MQPQHTGLYYCTRGVISDKVKSSVKSRGCGLCSCQSQWRGCGFCTQNILLLWDFKCMFFYPSIVPYIYFWLRICHQFRVLSPYPGSRGLWRACWRTRAGFPSAQRCPATAGWCCSSHRINSAELSEDTFSLWTALHRNIHSHVL